nr:phosphotransferase [Streptomyces sp. HNM0574]
MLSRDQVDELTVEQGQFHLVLIGAERVVCLARTGAAAARLPRRAAALRAVAALGLGVRTPEPLDVSVAGHVPPYLVLSRVPGSPLIPDELRTALEADDDSPVASQYARLLDELAAAGRGEPARAGLPRPAPDRWRRFAEEVRAELFPLMSERGRRRAEQRLAPLAGLPHVAGAVVHGDLGAENVLWTRDGDGLPVLSGVLDWDEVALGDPAEDLAAMRASHGPAFLRRVVASLGVPDPYGRLPERIAAIHGTFALQQALAAHRDGDDGELDDGLRGFR